MQHSAIVNSTDVKTEAEALAAIAEIGFHPMVIDIVGVEEDFHWHEFDAEIYVLSGHAAADFQDGGVLTAGPGTVVKIRAGVVHRDVPGMAFRGVFGFSIHPDKWTMPLNKQPSDLAAFE